MTCKGQELYDKLKMEQAYKEKEHEESLKYAYYWAKKFQEDLECLSPIEIEVKQKQWFGFLGPKTKKVYKPIEVEVDIEHRWLSIKIGHTDIITIYNSNEYETEDITKAKFTHRSYWESHVNDNMSYDETLAYIVKQIFYAKSIK
jgi:hypothetical protein